MAVNDNQNFIATEERIGVCYYTREEKINGTITTQ